MKNIRLRTSLGLNDTYVNFKIDHNFDLLEILSLKLTQEELYRKFCANYGAVAGRVIANNGFGVENAKISIFVPLSNEDNEERLDIAFFYPYERLYDKNEIGIRYNLLPDKQQSNIHKVIGTFPSENKILYNDILVEVYEKYYKYTTRTNESGDYMIFGIPVGNYEIHMDLDVSDIGYMSMTPESMVAIGYNEKLFENKDGFLQYKTSTTLDTLAQVVSQNSGVSIQPFWGDEDECGITIGITRHDFDISGQMELVPTARFFGTAMQNIQGKGQYSKNCHVGGRYEVLKIGSYKYEKTIVEVYDIDEFVSTGNIYMDSITGNGDGKSTPAQKYILEEGYWALELPMKKEKYITNEFGEHVRDPTDTKGVATSAYYKFLIYPYYRKSDGSEPDTYITAVAHDDDEVRGMHRVPYYDTRTKPQTFTGETFYTGNSSWKWYKFTYDLENKKHNYYTMGNGLANPATGGFTVFGQGNNGCDCCPRVGIAVHQKEGRNILSYPVMQQLHLLDDGDEHFSKCRPIDASVTYTSFRGRDGSVSPTVKNEEDTICYGNLWFPTFEVEGRRHAKFCGDGSNNGRGENGIISRDGNRWFYQPKRFYSLLAKITENDFKTLPTSSNGARAAGNHTDNTNKNKWKHTDAGTPMRFYYFGFYGEDAWREKYNDGVTSNNTNNALDFARRKWL